MPTFQRGVDLIVVLAGTGLVLQAVQRGARGRQIIRCLTAAQLDSSLRDQAVAGVVYETAFDGRGPHTEVSEILTRARCPVVVATDGSTQAVRDVLQLMQHSHEHFSFAAHWFDYANEVRRAVARLLTRGVEPSPVGRMMDALLPWIPEHMREPVLSAALLSQTDGGVRELAYLCGCASSAMRAMFADARVAQPHVWLGCLRSSHAAWWRIELGLSAADAARRGGFPGPDGMAHCVRLYTGRPLKEWRLGRGFTAVLEHCITRCLRPTAH